MLRNEQTNEYARLYQILSGTERERARSSASELNVFKNRILQKIKKGFCFRFIGCKKARD